jgi:hypothetical protein
MDDPKATEAELNVIEEDVDGKTKTRRLTKAEFNVRWRIFMEEAEREEADRERWIAADRAETSGE